MRSLTPQHPQQTLLHAPIQVWIISRHYSDDQRMGSLFQRIAQEIGDRVESAIDLCQIFRVPPQEALKLIKACQSVLEHWYSRYMEVSALAKVLLICGCVCVCVRACV